MEEIKTLSDATCNLSDTLLQDNQCHSPTTPPPTVLEAEEPPVLIEENDGLKTPTSAFNKIRPIFTCPPAPRKPKAAPIRKRKGSYRELRLLDLSTDVLSLYPPALLKDFNNKLKKVRRDHQQQPNKENIFININSSSK